MCWDAPSENTGLSEPLKTHTDWYELVEKGFPSNIPHAFVGDTTGENTGL